jgi:hypothetical protein
MTGKGLTGKNISEIQRASQSSQERNTAADNPNMLAGNNVLDLFPVKNDTSPMETNPANIFFLGTEQSLKQMIAYYFLLIQIEMTLQTQIIPIWVKSWDKIHFGT